jgi:hypothetical protein
MAYNAEDVEWLRWSPLGGVLLYDLPLEYNCSGSVVSQELPKHSGQSRKGIQADFTKKEQTVIFELTGKELVYLMLLHAAMAH